MNDLTIDEKEFLINHGFNFSDNPRKQKIFIRTLFKKYYDEDISGKKYERELQLLGSINRKLFPTREKNGGNLYEDDNTWNQTYKEFKRRDGSSFYLKHRDSFRYGKVYYTYYFKDKNISNGDEKILYTSMSPEDIFKIINNNRIDGFFENNFLSKERAESIFSKKNPNYIENKKDSYDNIGNGYAGHIEVVDLGVGALYPKIIADSDMFFNVYMFQKDSFVFDFKNNYVKFDRDDGSFFGLKFKKEITAPEGKLYSYYYRSQGDDGKDEKVLFSEMSPRDCFDLMLDNKKLSFFNNVFFSEERVRRIFGKIVPSNELNEIDSDDKNIGNGYAGYMGRIVQSIANSDFNHVAVDNHLNSNPMSFQFIYSLRRDKFINQLKTDYVKFSREDDSFFELKAKEIKKTSIGSQIYEYFFKDSNSEEEKILISELSPDDIFLIINNDKKLYFFKNVFLSNERVKRIFSPKEISLKSIQASNPDDYIGNGYAGYMGRIYQEIIPFFNHVVIDNITNAEKLIFNKGIYTIYSKSEIHDEKDSTGGTNYGDDEGQRR